MGQQWMPPTAKGARRTEEVYAWCRSRGEGRLFPTKGRSRDHHVPVSWTTIDKLPHSGRAIPGGLELYLLDVNHLKMVLLKRLSAEARQPILLHSGVGEDYARQIAAERLVKDKSGKLVWELLNRQNHLLDSTMNALACVDDSWTPSLRYMLENQEAEETSAADGRGETETGSVLARAASRANAILANR